MSFTGFFSYETIDEKDRSTIQVESYTSPDIIEYVDSEEFGDSEARFSQWYRLEKGASVSGLPPAPDILPDVEDHYRPKYPEEIGDNPNMHLVHLVNHHFANAEYNFHGGMGSLPWKEIMATYQDGDIKQWIPTWPDNIPFANFNHLTKDENLSIYNFFLWRQQGEAADTCLWFAQVLAGTTLPSHVDSSSMSKTEICGREVYVLHYDGLVSRPQSECAVAYSESSWHYYYHTGKQLSLDHRLGLESIPYYPTSTLILDESIAFVQSVLEPVDADLCCVVVNLFKSVNTLEKHGPYKTRLGLWGITGALNPPDLLPASKPDNCSSYIDVYLCEFWVKASYGMSAFAAQRAGHKPNSTVEHVFSWVDSLDSSSFVHPRSQTPQGGDGGMVWVALILVRLLLNTSVPTLKAAIHLDAPPDLDLACLGDEHNKVVSYINRLLANVTKTLGILAHSSHKRVIVAEPLISHPDPAEEDDSANIGNGSGADTGQSHELIPGPAAPLGGNVGKRSATKPMSRKTKGKQPARDRVLAASSGKGKRSTKSTKDPTSTTLNVSDDDRPASFKVISPAHAPALIDNSWFEPHVVPVDIDFNQRKHIFGRFSAQPTVTPHSGTPQDLLADLQKCLKQFDTAVHKWEDFDRQFDPCPSEACQQAVRLSEREPCLKLRPIVVGILLHRHNMNQSQALWPQVVSLTNPIILGTRMLSSISQAINTVTRDINKGPLRKKLATSQSSITAAIVRGQEIVEVLIRMEEVSTQWVNELQDAWNNDVGLMDLTAVMDLTQGLAKWRTETDETRSQFDRIHLNFRIMHELPGKPVPLRYRVGCPDPGIFDGEANGRLQAYPAGMHYAYFIVDLAPLTIYCKAPYPDHLNEKAENASSEGLAAGSTRTSVFPPTSAAPTSPIHIELAHNPHPSVTQVEAPAKDMAPASPTAPTSQHVDMAVAPPSAVSTTSLSLEAVEPSVDLVPIPGSTVETTVPAHPRSANLATLSPDTSIGTCLLDQLAIDPVAPPAVPALVGAELSNAATTTLAAPGNNVRAGTEEGSNSAVGQVEKSGQSPAAEVVDGHNSVAGEDGIASATASYGRRRSGRLAVKVLVTQPAVVKQLSTALSKGKRWKRDEVESLKPNDLEVRCLQVLMQTHGAGGSGAHHPGAEAENSPGEPQDTHAEVEEHAEEPEEQSQGASATLCGGAKKHNRGPGANKRSRKK
ncbi:hypothetical protein FRC10_010742 [Ceratobasidium sp. 414]|nr:hypothetical protein FRC10_010742 [Ceratobasidium sp. 414]